MTIMTTDKVKRRLLLFLLIYAASILFKTSYCDDTFGNLDDLQSKLVGQQVPLSSSSAPTTTSTAIDISNEYNLNLCGDTLQRPEANLELRTSNSFETLQLYQYGKIWPLSNRSFPINVACTLHLSACSACVIQLSWNSGQNKITLDPSSTNRGSPLKQTCEKPWDFKDATCFGVNFVEENADRLSMKPYRRFSVLNNTRYSNFTSTTYKIDLYLYAWRVNQEDAAQISQVFPIDFKVIDNSVTKRGKPASDLTTIKDAEGVVESPRFPKMYPEGVTVNYTLINEDPNGYVRLVFSDFNLHYMSSLEIIDSGGNVIKTATSSYGTSGRPCAVQSSGPTLNLVFTANHYTNEIGFRAHYKFVKDEFWPDKPSCKTCDKRFDDKGGYISIDSLDLDVNTYIDCIWLITKSRYAQVFYDRIYAKVEDFSVSTAGKNLQLEINDGLNSMTRKLLSIFSPRTREQLARDQPQEGFVTEFGDSTDFLQSADNDERGIYIRLRGYLGSYSGLGITFAQFYRWATAMCHEQNEFHCENGRCILSRYRCDGHDHCGDFSDELKERCHDKPTVNNGWENYGPKAGPPISYDEPNNNSSENRFPFNYTTTILLVAGLIGLTLVMLMVTVIVARVYRQRLIRRLTAQRRSQSLSSNHASFANPHADEQTGSRPGPSIHQVGNRRLLVLPESDIGVFEAPPTYDDALKHPTVPPDRRSVVLENGGSQAAAAVVSPVGVSNPTFLDDAGHLAASPVARIESPMHQNDETTGTATGGPLPPRLRLGSVSSNSDTCGSSSLPHSPVGSRSSVSSMGTVEHDAELTNEPSTSAAADTRGRLNGILKWARHRIRRGSSPTIDEQRTNSTALASPTAALVMDAPSTSASNNVVNQSNEIVQDAVAGSCDGGAINRVWPLPHRGESTPLTPTTQRQPPPNESLEMVGTLV